MTNQRTLDLLASSAKDKPPREGGRLPSRRIVCTIRHGSLTARLAKACSAYRDSNSISCQPGDFNLAG